MIRLFQGSGSGEISFESRVDDADWLKYKSSAIKLLNARNKKEAAKSLADIPFTLYQGTNFFNDEFVYLSAQCDLDMYVRLAEEDTPNGKDKYKEIARTLIELNLPIRFIVIELKNEEVQTVSVPKLVVTIESVKEALADAEQLLLSRSPVSAVDRLHTAFHGYLLEECRKNNITHDHGESITALFKYIQKFHPRFKAEVEKHGEVEKICRALAVIIDSLNQIRNQNSLAHPNESMIDEDEALLVVNCIRSLLHYLSAKL